MSTYFTERTSCPACRSLHRHIIYRRPFLESPIREFLEAYYHDSGRINFRYLEDADFLLDECLDCGLIYQRFVPTGLLLNDLYRVVSTTETRTEAIGRDKQNYYARQAEQLLTLLGQFPKAASKCRILDFGFGWARWACVAKGFGFDVYGVELDEGKKQHARELGIHVIEWEDIPGGNFDFIHADWVFEHIQDPVGTLEHFAKGLAPQGLIQISVPFHVGVKRRLRKHNWQAAKMARDSLNPVHPLEHINAFEGPSLDMMAAHCHLRPFRFPLAHEFVAAAPGAPKSFLLALLRVLVRRFDPHRGIRYFIADGPMEAKRRLPAKRRTLEAAA